MPGDMDARLRPLDELSEVRDRLDASSLPIPAERVMLLVALVPHESCTTVTTSKDCMNKNFQFVGNT